MDSKSIAQSLVLFVIAGLCEIGGGWMIWKWLRSGKPAWWGLVGAVILVVYGVLPTLQTSHFSRVYAVYGGFFIALSIVWGWYFDASVPDRPDLVGAGIALFGVAIMMYWPRVAVN